MERFLQLLAASRCRIIGLCVNLIRHRFSPIAIRVTRRIAEYLIQASILTSSIHSVLLDSRINSICEKLDALNRRNSPPTCRNEDCIVRHFCLPFCNTTGTRSQHTVESRESDLRVEIGSRGESDCTVHKRAATCDSLARGIDPSAPLDSQIILAREFVVHPCMPKNETLLPEGIGPPAEFPGKGTGRRECSMTYRINPPREKWRNARLRIVVYKIIPKDRDHLTRLKALRHGRLRLPCKPIYLMLEILQADPALLDCLIVARRNFEDGVHNVCSLVNDIIGKLDIRAIKKLRLNCEIYPGRINFKLVPGGARKPKLCLFVTRVLICQDTRSYDFPRETNTTPHPSPRKESAHQVCNVPVNQGGSDECDKCDIFYSPCSNASLIPQRSAKLETSNNHQAERNDLAVSYSKISTVKPSYIATCDREICTIEEYVNRPGQNQSIQCESDTLRKTARTAETNTDAGIYSEKRDVHRDCRINNTDEIVQTDNRTMPEKRSCSTQASKAKVNETATDCQCYQTEDRASSPVTRNKINNSINSPNAGSKAASIRTMGSRSSSNSDDKHRPSQSFINDCEVDGIDSRQPRVATRFNNASRIPIKKPGARARTGDFCAQFNETKAAVRSVMTARPGFSASSSEEHYHIRRSKIRLVSRMLHSHGRSPKSTFVRTTLRYVRNPRSPVQYTIRISSNSLTRLERFRSRIETKIEQKQSLLSCMKRRALRKSDRLKSRIYRSSRKSLDKIKHLIHRKLRRFLLTSEDRATSTSKLILTEDGYFISVSGVKLRHRRTICDSHFQKTDKSIDKSSNPKSPCVRVSARAANHEEFGSVQDRSLEETREGSRKSYQRSQCLCYENVLRESKRHSTETPRSKRARSNTNDCGKREFHTRNREGSALPAKHAHNRHSIKKAASQANKEYDSGYRDTKGEDCPIPSTDQCFLQVSKVIGLANTCEQCIHDMESVLRMKLSEYVTLCKSAKDSLVRDTWDDAFQGSETFPAPCSNRFGSR